MPYPLGLGYFARVKTPAMMSDGTRSFPTLSVTGSCPKEPPPAPPSSPIKLPSSSSSSFLLLLALRLFLLDTGCVAPSSRPFLQICIYKYIEILRFVSWNLPALPLSISLAEPDTNTQIMLANKPWDFIYALRSTSPIEE